MTEAPLVSVIINCFNGEKYIREAIDSVIAQTYKNWELVFWDNQSTDSTRSIVESYENTKIKYFYAPEHTPLGEARNLAVKKANGEYVNFLDADDLWSDNKLEEQLLLVSDKDNCQVVYTPFTVFTDNGDNISDKMIRNYRRLERRKVNDKCAYQELLKGNYVIFSSLLFKKVLYTEVGGVDNSYQQYEDYDLLLKLALRSNIKCAKKACTYYRVHGGNNTSKNGIVNLEENRRILSNLPKSKDVEKAIRRNETHVAWHLFINNGKIIKGLKYISEKGSWVYFIKLIFQRLFT